MNNEVRNFNFERIGHLADVVTRHKAIETEEKELSRPVQTDREQLRALYVRFEETIESLPYVCKMDNSERIKLFLAIALYLYDPAVLVGRKTSRGMREALANTLNVTPITVSYHLKDLWIRIEQYGGFRKKLSSIFNRMDLEERCNGN